MELKANVQGDVESFKWEMSVDDGTTWAVIPGEVNPSYFAFSTGSYRVTVTQNGSPTIYNPVDIIVYSKPVPDFSFTNNYSCSGTPVQFTPAVTSGKAPFTYTWNFGDGVTSSDQNPTHAYNSLGCSTTSYSVTLTVKDANECSNTITKQVTVKQLPDVQLTDLQNPFNEFSNCVNAPSASSPSFTVRLGNNSPSASCITTYSINWGDGTLQSGLTGSSFPLSHTYTSLGTFDLVVTATSSNGCSNSKTYKVVNQSNPAVGISAPGSTSGCAPSGFWFKLSRYELNSPGTIYVWDFGDGSPSVTWTTPVLVDSIFHVFTKTSCDQPNGQFIVKVTAINGCKATTATVDNITIYEKPKAGFTAPASACVNQTVTFTNTSIGGYNQGSCSRITNYKWDFGDGTTSTLQSPSHSYAVADTYTVTLTAEGSCGSDIVIKHICVTASAVASFNLNNATGCAPLSVSATNTSNTLGSCAAASYYWSVAYSSSNCGTSAQWSFANGTSASSQDPSFTFTGAGIYTITLSVTTACGTVTSSKTVTVTRPPVVTLASIPNACGPVSINPSATVSNCGSSPLTYQWNFSGGTPATSTLADPGPVSFSSPGLHTITLKVTNGCGTTEVRQGFTINEVPVVTVPANQTFCAGQAAGPYSFTASPSGATISWSSNTTAIELPAASGGSSMAAFTATNSSSSPITATITVKAVSNGCTGQASFTITVNPRPTVPLVTTPVMYCQYAGAAPLAATPAAGNTLNWYTMSSGGTPSAAAFTPSTAVVGSTTYYVSQTDPSTGCEGPRASIVVMVKAAPNISNSTSANPTSCNTATGFINLSGLNAAATYSVAYTKNGTPVSASLTASSSGVITIGSLTSGVYENISVTLNGCTSNVVGPFSLSDPNPPTVPVVTSNGPLCSGSTLSLTALSTTPGVSYSWTGPNGFTSTQQKPNITNVTTAAAGTYNVTARLSGCTSAAGSVTVVVNPTPATPAVSSNSPLCSGSTLNLSVGTGAYGVSYSWTGPSGFTSTEQNPTIANVSTAASGTYSVTATQGSCSSMPGTTVVTVRPTPSISSSSFTDPTACASATGTIVLNGLTAGAAYAVNYTKNGAPITSTITTSPSGVLTISGLTAGAYENISVTLNGCPSGSVGPFTLTDPNPPQTPTVSSNSPVCSGGALNLSANTTTAGAVTYSWTGPNGFSSAIQNPVITNASTAASGTYTVTVKVNGCSASASLPAIVNPKPAAPALVSPVQYCQNAVPLPLSATGTNLTWYTQTDLTGGTSSAPIPSTANAGTTLYYVTQTNSSGCQSDPVAITVTVNPALAGNFIRTGQTICSGSTPAPLTAQSGMTGGTGSYRYQWQVSTDGGANWNNIPGAQNPDYAPGMITADTRFRRLVSSGPCLDDPSNEVLITVQGGITSYEIGAPQVICAGTIPALLAGQAPAGGSGSYTYTWESSPDNTNWTQLSDAAGQDYQPGKLNVTMYFRRKVVSGSCSAYSLPVKITVNPRPVLAPVTSDIYCNQSLVVARSFSSTPASGVSYVWSNDNTAIGLPGSGTGNLPAFTATGNSSPKVPQIATISVVPIYSGEGVSCPGDPASFTITVLPEITVAPIVPETVCTGTTITALTPIHDAGAFDGSTVSYSWAVSGQGINLISGTGSQIPAYSTINEGTTDLVATITVTPQYSYSGSTCSGNPVSYTVTVKPTTPSAAAGPDATLCAAPSYTMQAAATSGTTGLWAQTGGSTAGIADPTSPTTQITGLQVGNTYTFRWTVKGFASCPATSDDVVIRVLSPLTNLIDGTLQTICFDQTVTVTGQQPSGGSGIYTYRWEMSTDGSVWSEIPSQASMSLTFKPLKSVYVRRIVTSLPCTQGSTPVYITVLAPISNNTISADQSICFHTAASVLRGSAPSGADDSYQYQWQSSTDGGASWNRIPGATQMDFDPSVLDITTKFRRVVSTNLCTGPQSNTSNEVTVTVNPDAKALFSQSKDVACAPFVIDGSVIMLQPLPDRNSVYEWYAGDNLLGTGDRFPGYTISGSGDSIVIRLKAISRFGCKSDSIAHKFFTVIEPQPDFTLSTSEGCGPLAVAITNTTPKADLFTYRWDFGNGQTSQAEQPGTVTFLPNPMYGDTTYVVKLQALSSCKAIEVSRPVLVKSRPKALFAPNRSVGCSPMTVTFNNTSLGNASSYTWDFGDGTTVSTAVRDTLSHTYYTAVRDTFYVKLIVTNECGSDSMRYAIVVAPNTIKLDFALNGNEQLGCAPHTVNFINNSKGASLFRWDFGDGNVLSTTKNVDTVAHTFLASGTYVVHLLATNGCSDTSTTETITVFPKPTAAFTVNRYTACLGDSLRFINRSDSASSYLWTFGDGSSSTLVNPTHSFRAPGNYTVVLHSFRVNAPGNSCSDSTTAAVQVVASLPGWFTASDSVGSCAPFTVTFTNRNTPSVTTGWDFGDGTSGSGDVVTHTYTHAGTYLVTLTTTVPGGCRYVTTKTVKVLGPDGTLQYQGGFLCNQDVARFEATVTGTDSLIWNFGDGTILRTSQRVVYHDYPNPGAYVPSVELVSSAGCRFMLQGRDTVKVDKLSGGFTSGEQKSCGYTTVAFADTSHVFYGKTSVRWDFGDGTTGWGSTASHTYTATGTYTVRMMVAGSSGCTHIATVDLPVTVNSQPEIFIEADTTGCSNDPVTFRGVVQSTDHIGLLQWTLSNGVTSSQNPFALTLQPGTYIVRLVAGTVNGCYDTAYHTVRIRQAPVVTASADVNLCRGNSIPLTATGAQRYEWTPLEGLSCTSCSNPVASPLVTTPYVVKGFNTLGCPDEDTVVVTVIQPFKMNVSADDSICIGQSANLLASGATTYSWSPAASLSSTTASNPVATPTTTTRYRVVGYDGFNCFTDTAFVLVAVGDYPTVNLGPDQTLATGTLLPLKSVVQNGPIRRWVWTPPTNLGCANCPEPVAEVKRDITYSVVVTSAYGCSATDTISIKAFCQNAQVFIPNAFTPDGDGVNDLLMVRGSGIVTVKSFRIFNRWGEVIFERSSFPPNDPKYGWDGRIRRVVSGPDVFVYTAEVVCENGTPFTYKGNVSILK